MKNKIISILIILSFCFVLPVCAKSDDLFTAIELTAFEGETVTRAEFVAKISKILKLAYSGGQDRFTDISGHEHHDSIYAALVSGLIAPADKFNPDDEILTVDAYRVALAATGWVPRIKASGGSDVEYLSYAKKLDLTKGISSEAYSPLNTEDANTLLSNMLSCDTEEQTVFGDGIEYRTREGNTLLSMLYDINEVTGIVTANEYTGINSADDATDKDRIRIGTVEYIAKNKQDYLGKNVRAYYISDSPLGKNVIVALEVEKTKELTIDARLIKNVDGRILYYYEGNRIKNVRLEDSFSCIKNGKKLDLYTNDLTSIFTASQDTELTLIDANRDLRYETVLMTVRKYCYVEAVDENGVFYDKYQTDNNIDLSDSDIQYRFTDNSMTPEDIKTGMLLTFTRSDDGQVLSIDTEYSVIDGKIERFYSGNEGVVISGQKYELTEYYVTNFSSVVVGKSGLFYLDSKGRLVVYSEDAEPSIYGWIIRTAYDGSFNETLCARIYTQNDKSEIYNFAEKVKVDGGRPVKLNQSDIEDRLQTNNRLVKYRLNKNGEISEIYFPRTVTSIEEALSQDSQFRQFHSGSYRWQKDDQVFMEAFIVDSGSFLFIVPETESLRADEQNFNVFNGAKGIFSSNSTYNVISFDESREGVASVVLYLKDIMTANTVMSRAMDSYAWVVEEKVNGIDEAGNPRIELFVCNGSTYKTVYSGENNISYIDTIEPGDIIRFIEENDHVIKLIHLDFDFSSKTVNETDYTLQNTYSGGAGYVQGYLYGKYGSYMHIYEDAYNGDGIYRTDYTYSDLKGYPVSSTYTVYVDVKVNKNGDIKSLTTYRAGSGVTPVESRFTGEEASYVVSLFRSGTKRSTIFYNIHAE